MTTKANLLFSSGDKLAVLSVAGDHGVDLAAIGRALALDPASIRLNGHFLSRDAKLRSAVTWASLIDFFGVRGFPTGVSEDAPIVVAGKPVTDAPALQLLDLDFKRKVVVQDDHAHKRIKINGSNTYVSGVQNGHQSDDESICIKRRLKLDEDNSSKRVKAAALASGLVKESSKHPLVLPKLEALHGCLSEQGKRQREDLGSVYACKRVRCSSTCT